MTASSGGCSGGKHSNGNGVRLFEGKLIWNGWYGRMDRRANGILGWKSCRISERLQSYGREKDLLMARCWSISFLIALLVRISAVLMHYEQVSLRLPSFRERLFLS